MQPLLLSRFSHVGLWATPQTAAHQVLPSLGFSRQADWSGLPFPSPMHESESEVAQSCLTLHDLMDCSLPGSLVHEIFQARILEWVVIAFSKPSAEFLAITIMPSRPLVLMQDGAQALQKAPAHLEASPRCSPTRHLPPKLTARHHPRTK